MLTTIPKAYKLFLENRVDIHVLSNPKVVEAWLNNPYIDSIFTEANPASKFDITVDVNNLETKWKEGTFSSEGPYHNRTKVYLENLGLALLNKTPVYRVTDEERLEAEETITSMFGNTDQPLIGISLYSAGKCKTYPKMEEVANLVEHNVIYLDQKNHDGNFFRTFRQTAALVEQCDVIVSADSAILHLAGALKKRVVGVFGSTGGKVYTEDYEKATVVQASCPDGKSECWWTVPCLPGSTYYEKMDAGEAKCLRNLSPIEVVDAVEYQLTKPKKILICMLTYNLVEMTKKALESVRSWHDYEILVVDNESTDGTQEWLKKNGYQFISKRTSVASAQNIALRKFLEGDYDLFIFLNNDIVLRYDYVDELVKAQKRTGAWGIVGEVISTTPPWAVDDKVITDKRDLLCMDIPAGAYSATLLTRECVEKVGLFDEHFTPRYIEDNDYNIRIYLAGGKFMQTTHAQFFHSLGAVVKTNKEEGASQNIHWNKNIAYFAEKWGLLPHGIKGTNGLGPETRKGELKEWLKNNKSGTVNVRRTMGGWGDILFTTVVGRELHKHFPTMGINYTVPPQFLQLVLHVPEVSQSMSIGGHRPSFDLDLTDVEFRHEWQEVARYGRIMTPRPLLYLQIAGLPETDFQPRYTLTDAEKCTADGVWGSGTKKKVVVVPTGSNTLKNWHGMSELTTRLKESCNVIVSSNKYNFFEMAAIIGRADLVVSPDTGLSNIAGALGVPVLTLFSNRNGDVFERIFPSMKALQGHCPYRSSLAGAGCDYRMVCTKTEGPYRPKENIGEPECFKCLSVDEVYVAARSLL